MRNSQNLSDGCCTSATSPSRRGKSKVCTFGAIVTQSRPTPQKRQNFTRPARLLLYGARGTHYCLCLRRRVTTDYFFGTRPAQELTARLLPPNPLRQCFASPPLPRGEARGLSLKIKMMFLGSPFGRAVKSAVQI